MESKKLGAIRSGEMQSMGLSRNQQEDAETDMQTQQRGSVMTEYGMLLRGTCGAFQSYG